MINFLYDGTRVVCGLDSGGSVSASYGYGAAGLAQTYAQSLHMAYTYDPMGSVNSRVGQVDNTNSGSTTPA